MLCLHSQTFDPARLPVSGDIRCYGVNIFSKMAAHRIITIMNKNVGKFGVICIARLNSVVRYSLRI
jgi:hypothetical protein